MSPSTTSAICWGSVQNNTQFWQGEWSTSQLHLSRSSSSNNSNPRLMNTWHTSKPVRLDSLTKSSEIITRISVPIQQPTSRTYHKDNELESTNWNHCLSLCSILSRQKLLIERMTCYTRVHKIVLSDTRIRKGLKRFLPDSLRSREDFLLIRNSTVAFKEP
mgnify:CR=1 FL=1